MAITFKKLSRGELFTPVKNTAYLQPDNWDDFGYKTLFSLTVFDEQCKKQDIGNVKIGFTGQKEGRTEEKISQSFDVLPDTFYSLGQDTDYYQNIVENLTSEMATELLTALRDVVSKPCFFDIIEKEEFFTTSLIRSVNRSTIKDQFRRILKGEALLTAYNFVYRKVAIEEGYSGISVKFEVNPNTKPSSNIHILIGRNGVGKTTLLNNMVKALLIEQKTRGEAGFFGVLGEKKFLATTEKDIVMPKDYFSGVVFVSFSAFDSFNDRPYVNEGVGYQYIGLRKALNQQDPVQWGVKNKEELCKDFTESLKLCFSLSAKRTRWVNAVKKLESDCNFAEMDLCQLTDLYADDSSSCLSQANELFKIMSSGHAIVLLMITRLVETVAEKTLVLLDEPESHLHPPLLSAFTRALSDLLVNRNGVAIIATHSPVVLQEVPKSCVSIIRKNRSVLTIDKPERETFAENVGILTRDVFGLEVSKSGFHSLLESSVEEGGRYEDIEKDYQCQLGFEGKAILRTMVFIRDSQEKKDK